jgi:hypothetical protein
MIWLWYMFVLIWNTMTFFTWIYREIPKNAQGWTLRRVFLIDKNISNHKNRINHFLTKYLDSDGKLFFLAYFLLKINLEMVLTYKPN